MPTNATAVVANLTATDVTATTYVSLWPAGTKQPATSNLNAGKGDTRANTVVLPLGGGKLSVYNNLGRANLIVDILGWYVPAGTDDGAGQFVPAVPSRILDTRTGNGGHYGKLGQGATMTLPVLGRGGVPKTAVSAVVLNVTAVAPTAQTYVTAWPSGQARPGASNLNALPGQIVPNLVIVPVGADGAVQLYNDRGVVDLVADVAGWITS